MASIDIDPVEEFINVGRKIYYYFVHNEEEAEIELQRNPEFRQFISDSYNMYLNAKKVDPDIDDIAKYEWYYKTIIDYGPSISNLSKLTVANAENDRSNMEVYVKSFTPIQRYKPWVGNRTNIILSIAFLLRDNPESSACVVFRASDCLRNDHTCTMHWNDNDSMLETTEQFDKNLKGCLSDDRKKIVLISLYISNIDDDWAHLNFIIIRKTGNGKPIAQHFEPHGNSLSATNQNKMENDLSNYFKQFNCGYAPVVMMCPVGLQDIECDYEDRQCKDTRNDPGGYCATWSLFFVQTALKFSHMWTDNITTLVSKVLDRDPKAFHKFIVNYSQFLYKNIELMILQEKVSTLGPKPKMIKRDLNFLRGTREGLRESTAMNKEKSLKLNKQEQRLNRSIKIQREKYNPDYHVKSMAMDFIKSHQY